MLKTRQIHTQKTKVRENDIVLAVLREYYVIGVCSLIICLASMVSMVSLASLSNLATTSYTLEKQLNELKEENSTLESQKQKSFNIKEIQKRAMDLGFTFSNNKITYIKSK